MERRRYSDGVETRIRKDSRKSSSSNSSTPSPSRKKNRSISTNTTGKQNEDLLPLESFIDDCSALSQAALSSLDWKVIELLLPPVLKGRSKDDVIQFVADELEGMSKKRILSVINGSELSSSSSSESESDLEEEREQSYEQEVDRVSVSLNESNRPSPSTQSSSDQQSNHDDDDANDDEAVSRDFSPAFSDVELIEGTDYIPENGKKECEDNDESDNEEVMEDGECSQPNSPTSSKD